MSDQYNAQNRGSRQEYLKYLSSMDSVCVDKVASASVFFSTNPGNVIVDIGMASGTTTNILAHLFPTNRIIGVDINSKMVDFAKNSYQAPNLEFRIDDGEKLTTFKEKSVDGFFNCSSIHHITSFNNYDPNRALNAIKRQTSLLKEGGILIIRDFVKPPDKDVYLELSTLTEDSQPCDADLLIDFSKKARLLSSIDERGFPLLEVKSVQKNNRRFKVHFSDAVEFIRRKDYYSNWDLELQEEYGYFTAKDFEEAFMSLGLRIIISFPVYNPWIVKNRYRNKFLLSDTNGNNLGYPPSNYLIAGEKVKNKGTSIKITRYLPEKEDSFLKYQSYKNLETNKVYDVVFRPNPVVDFLPYYVENDRIEIIAKHGCPRPIVNVETDSPTIDQKHFGGFITEGLTASFDHPVVKILEERANIGINDIEEIEKSLEYFTSPGGIDEKVESIFVRLKESPKQEILSPAGLSGFRSNGSIRTYDAVQLLKTAQTGALAEARLELNIYNLLKHLKIELPEWLGEKIEIPEIPAPIRNITPLNDLQKIEKGLFVPTNETAFYLQKQRAKFSETGITGSSDILEYVTPQQLSINTLVTLPVVRHNNIVYVGLEIRHLPVPEKHTGNSYITVAPAIRLPKNIATYYDLESFILNQKIFLSSGINYYKLGEKFFPSAGVTPEQVYPYIITLTETTDELKWVSLQELYDCFNLIRDGHLLITLSRLFHALKHNDCA
jgi:ubiquinone/menaquinone biosynthesis C-methylase UbiE